METTIPLVIIAYNNLTFVKSFLEQVTKYATEIIILDNHTTYQKQLDYYDELEKNYPVKLTIHRLSQNYGHRVYQKRADLLPKVYILSDPDLLLHKDMPLDAFQRLLDISNKHRAFRVGLCLDVSDHDKFIQGSYGELVYKIESGYYNKRIPDDEYELYEAPIDTTFVLINGNLARERKQIRVGGNFLAKHLPWYHNYLKENIPRDELEVWVKNNISSSILKYMNPLD